MKRFYYVLVVMAVLVLVSVFFVLFIGRQGATIQYPAYGNSQSAPTSTPTPPPAVPAEYQSLYGSFTNIITGLNNNISGWNGSLYPVSDSIELLTANDNGGLGVISNTSAINNELARDHAMGVRAVEVAIGFTVFDPNFWQFQGQSATQAQQTAQNWESFYASVRQSIHNLGMKMIVEANPVITTQPGMNPQGYNKSFTSFATYEQRRSAANVIIAKVVQPDYLIVQSEPQTDAVVVGNPTISSVLNDPTGDTKMVAQFVADLESANVPGLHAAIQLGAGEGTWQPNWQQYLSGLVAIHGLDKIDCHIYDLRPGVNQIGEIAVATKIIDAAHAAGKAATVVEFWDRKSLLLSGLTPNGDPIADVNARDDFSFWIPLDEQFMSFMIKFANYEKLDYISAFPSELFSAYLDYGSSPCKPVYPPTTATTNAACDARITTAENQSAAQMMRATTVQLSGMGSSFVANAAQYSAH